jgi:hypothetical protein
MNLKAGGGPFVGAPSIAPQEISEAAEIDKAQEISFKFKHVVECRFHCWEPEWGEASPERDGVHGWGCRLESEGDSPITSVILPAMAL